jgi:hypothetical protein
MKKTLIITGIILIAISTFVLVRQVYASTLIASYSSSNYIDSLAMSSGGNNIYLGQDFLVSQSNLVLDSANFYLYKSLLPTGNAYATLYAMTGTYGSGGKPTGNALATSTTYDVTGLTGSSQTITFNFTGANRVALTNGNYYCIEIYFTGGGSGNSIDVGYGTASMSGDYNKSTDGITFSAFQTKNIIFSVYGASSGGDIVAIDPNNFLTFN